MATEKMEGRIEAMEDQITRVYGEMASAKGGLQRLGPLEIKDSMLEKLSLLERMEKMMQKCESLERISTSKAKKDGNNPLGGPDIG